MSRTYFVYLYNMVLFDDVFSEYMHLNPLDTVEMNSLFELFNLNT